MMRSFARLALALGVSFALVAACGSEDSKKKVSEAEAGAAGASGAGPTNPTSGGSSSLAEAGAGGASAGAGGEAPSGGFGGAVVNAGGVGGAGGASGAGGAAGAPVCCQPKECPVAMADAPCGYTIDDGCGNPEKNCECAIGFECSEGSCSACDPNGEPCENNPSLCGDTFDSCGDPITCPDNCSQQSAGGVCLEGWCCSPKLECAPEDCGVVDNGCGGTIDCTGNSCGTESCVDGRCCTADPGACVETECGDVWDGCEVVHCSSCPGTQKCYNNSCIDSVCDANGDECGSEPNSQVIEADEFCGDCADDQGCVDHRCLQLCH